MICSPECPGLKGKGPISLFDFHNNRLLLPFTIKYSLVISNGIQIPIKITLPIHILPILSLNC
jgi:hypothetical protein